jgi:hypothetical protein
LAAKVGSPPVPDLEGALRTSTTVQKMMPSAVPAKSPRVGRRGNFLELCSRHTFLTGRGAVGAGLGRAIFKELFTGIR